MSVKNESRLRRARRARTRIRDLGVNRLSVHRTPRHIYAQIIAPEGARVLVTASTLDAALRQDGNTRRKHAAATVGWCVGGRASAPGLPRVAFCRSGFRYRGRVRGLAEAAREGGLEF